MRSSDLDLIFVAGLGGSGADHWQTRWRAKLPTAVSVEQANWDRPALAQWTDNVVATCGKATRPILLIAHSLGVTTVAHAASRLAAFDVKGAFLVAPPGDDFLNSSPFSEFGPTSRAPLPFPSLVVAGRDDSYGSIDASRRLARDWGADFMDAGAVGHINAESGHGPWPEGLMSLSQLLKKI
jgi:uncharacterized protein